MFSSRSPESGPLPGQRGYAVNVCCLNEDTGASSDLSSCQHPCEHEGTVTCPHCPWSVPGHYSTSPDRLGPEADPAMHTPKPVLVSSRACGYTTFPSPLCSQCDHTTEFWAAVLCPTSRHVHVGHVLCSPGPAGGQE